MKNMKTFDARTLERWRRWLATHHASASEIWHILHKRHTGKPSIAYDDAVDEALCYGWIDSLIKRIDDDRYARKFTPRKANSTWSSANVRRYAALKASHRLAAPGLERAPDGRPIVDMPPLPTSVRDGVPPYIEKGLRQNPVAWKCFERLPPSHRRRYVLWIDTAKREETKQHRLRQAIDKLRAGQELGLK